MSGDARDTSSQEATDPRIVEIREISAALMMSTVQRSEKGLTLSMLASRLISCADALTALQQRVEQVMAERSKLQDAAFHFQTCATCKRHGDDACESGRQFAAFLRGELDGD